jgi:glycosyltransferase involved in cell wall biosynthesis
MAVEHIAVYDLGTSGHHLEFLSHLCEYWIKRTPRTSLTLIVGVGYQSAYEKSFGSFERLTQAGIRLSCVSPEEEFNISRGSRVRRSLAELRLLTKYVRAANAQHCIAMNFDDLQFALLFAARLDFKVSGIYFRPAFGYPRRPGQSFGAYQAQRLKALIVRRVLLRHDVSCVFSLDEHVADYNPVKNLSGKRRYLPDPIDTIGITPSRLSSVMSDLALPRDRRVALLFGSIESRKGINVVLEAIRRLPEHVRAQLTVLIVGKFVENNVTPTPSEVRAVCNACSVAIRIVDRFVARDDVPGYFEVSDFVLALYPDHTGSSGVVLRACAAGKPILGSNFGWIGRVLVERSVGVPIDSRDSQEVARGLTQLITEPLEGFFSPEGAAELMRDRNPDAFADRLLSSVTSKAGGVAGGDRVPSCNSLSRPQRASIDESNGT